MYQTKEKIMSTKIRWYGHATFGIDLNDFRLLLDPFFNGNSLTTQNPDELEADFILITHGHGDHVGDALSIARRTGATIISNFEIAEWFEKQGFTAHGQHIGGGFNHPFGYLKMTLALHGSALPDDSDGGNPGGFILTTPEGEKVYFAGDTGLFGDMQLIGDEGIDLAFLPIGDNYTMGPDDALLAVKMLRPKTVVPIHYNTFKVIEQDPFAWAQRVMSVSDSRVVVMQPGETISVD